MDEQSGEPDFGRDDVVVEWRRTRAEPGDALEQSLDEKQRHESHREAYERPHSDRVGRFGNEVNEYDRQCSGYRECLDRAE